MSAVPRSDAYARFAEAKNAAVANGLPDYGDWRTALERQYTVMPLWYWDTVICRRNYAEYIQERLIWQQRQVRINQGNAAFHHRLGRSAE
ncbi:MAG: hypothetical protein OEU46_20035 [Alphaproteobacteria bacterium]|nr:hypothetical protein [Alphaproteobacteria bacterium]